MSLWTRITGVVKFVTFYCFILCLIILHPRHTLNGWKYLEQSCVVIHRFHKPFSQSRRRPLLGPPFSWKRFQPKGGPSRGLLRDCENWLRNRWITTQHLFGAEQIIQARAHGQRSVHLIAINLIIQRYYLFAENKSLVNTFVWLRL